MRLPCTRRLSGGGASLGIGFFEGFGEILNLRKASFLSNRKSRCLDLISCRDMFSIMPIYEFNCEDCDKEFETLVRTSDWEGEVECPSWGAGKLEKKLSVVAAGSAEGPSVGELPLCSGIPSNCGRCASDN